MVVSTDAILFYGYNLGGDDAGWKVNELDEYGDWTPAWYDPDADEDIGDVMERQLASAEGVYLGYHCSDRSPQYFLAACEITANRGASQDINWAKLEAERVAQGWDNRLSEGLTRLGITPKQNRPQWTLVSFWG